MDADWLLDVCGDLLEKSRVMLEEDGATSEDRMPVGVWAGFADLGRGRGREVLSMLAEAGVSKVVFTPTNDASKGFWRWQPSRSQIVRGIVAAKELGLEVWLGPWVRCDPSYMHEAGLHLRGLADEVGGVDGWELDAEGSWEVSAKSKGRRHRGGVAGAVSDALSAMTAHMKDEEELGATLLYFNRPGGDALLREERVISAVIQAYSVWFPGVSSKAVATHTPGFQPGTLQDRAWENYVRFKESRSLERLEMGLGWWSQDRSGAPAVMRLSKAEAFRKASDASLRLGADGVMGWACHLWDSPKKKGEKEYLRLVLEEVRYLTQSRRPEGWEDKGWPEAPGGAVIRWDELWDDPKVRGGGRPKGYRTVKGLGLDASLFGRVARVLRAEALERGWERGACVPFEQEGREMVGVFQKHTATWRGGKLISGLDLDGLTIFARSSKGGKS